MELVIEVPNNWYKSQVGILGFFSLGLEMVRDSHMRCGFDPKFSNCMRGSTNMGA
jgi:hypothetical protein